MGKIRKIIGAFLHAPERFDELARLIVQAEDGLNRRMDGLTADRFVDGICESRDRLEKLNNALSTAPTVWGDPERLEIDETAAVFTCFFNTNSGRIRIGRYTFAGSGVSLLAGSHDPRLAGFARRDAEFAEGYDIEIGDGVWLASGCTVLGPCRIGDNAVIAAGAVVIPGTEVPAGTIWVGVPAREIGRVEAAGGEDTASPAVLDALRRENGTLFTGGWSARTRNAFPEAGHWLLGEGTVLTGLKKAKIKYRLENAENADLRIAGSGGEITLPLHGGEGETVTDLPAGEEGIRRLVFRLAEPGASLMIAVVPAAEGSNT